MKKLIKIFLIFILVFLLSNESKSAPNYSFTTNTSNINSPQSSINQSSVNVYTPNDYVQNRVVNVEQKEYIEFVIDYSNSMKPWINQAKKTILEILPQISSSTYVGMRVFGHKISNSTLASNNLFKNVAHSLKSTVGGLNDRCYATEQIVSLKKVNISYLVNAMNNTQIGSATPLTFALQQAAYTDFGNKNLATKKKLILITDGGETCGGDPCAFVRRLVRDRNDIQIDVIMINGLNNLKCLSEYTNGNFYRVNSMSGFDSALKNAVTNSSPQNVQNNQSGYVVTPSQNATHYQFISE